MTIEFGIKSGMIAIDGRAYLAAISDVRVQRGQLVSRGRKGDTYNVSYITGDPARTVTIQFSVGSVRELIDRPRLFDNGFGQDVEVKLSEAFINHIVDLFV